jgi:hypothetical protein
MNTTGQRQRILDRLLAGYEVPAVELHRIGSGKENGYCASLTRRISEIRDEGYDVICRKEMVDGTMHTFYTLVIQK